MSWSRAIFALLGSQVVFGYVGRLATLRYGKCGQSDVGLRLPP
jgi:hypothetical protein